MITITNVTKQYPNKISALSAVNFTIPPGVFGLLGHNGAGKTTLMKAIATILTPTSGSICVMGYDTKRQGDAVRARIGYLPQALGMYQSLSVIDFVSYMAALKGVKNPGKVRAAIEQVDMGEFSHRRIGALSGGMQRRVGIAQAMVGEPEILIVDEPTAGLDPEERVRFRGVLSRFAQTGKTVILSTHIVEDVYKICNSLAVLRKGRLFFTGKPADLLLQITGKVKVLTLESEQALLELRRRAIVLAVTYGQNGIEARIMDEAGVFSAPTVQETPEDAYVYCMGGKSNA